MAKMVCCIKCDWQGSEDATNYVWPDDGDVIHETCPECDSAVRDVNYWLCIYTQGGYYNEYDRTEVIEAETLEDAAELSERLGNTQDMFGPFNQRPVSAV